MNDTYVLPCKCGGHIDRQRRSEIHTTYYYHFFPIEYQFTGELRITDLELNKGISESDTIAEWIDATHLERENKFGGR